MLLKNKKFYQETSQIECSKPLLTQVLKNTDSYTYYWDLLNYPYVSLFFQHSFDGVTWFDLGVLGSPPVLITNTGSFTVTILDSPQYFRILGESQYRECGTILSNIEESVDCGVVTLTSVVDIVVPAPVFPVFNNFEYTWNLNNYPFTELLLQYSNDNGTNWHQAGSAITNPSNTGSTILPSLIANANSFRASVLSINTSCGYINSNITNF